MTQAIQPTLSEVYQNSEINVLLVSTAYRLYDEDNKGEHERRVFTEVRIV